MLLSKPFYKLYNHFTHNILTKNKIILFLQIFRQLFKSHIILNLREVFTLYHGKKVILRELRPQDLPYIMEYVNNYDTYSPFTDAAPRPKTEEYQLNWLENSTREDLITFAIADMATEEFLGTCQLRSINRACHRSLFSIILKPSAQGRGYGSDALRTLLRFAFQELNLHKVTLMVYASNEGGRRLYEKVGFTYEGTLRQEVYRRGIYEDQLVYSILEREFGGQDA